MPGEPLLLGAGALAGNGRLSLWLVARIRPLAGGFEAWQERSFPVEPLPIQPSCALAV